MLEQFRHHIWKNNIIKDILVLKDKDGLEPKYKFKNDKLLEYREMIGLIRGF